MFFGAGLAGCSTMVHMTFFQESDSFPHHFVGDCLQNAKFSEENEANLWKKQRQCHNLLSVEWSYIWSA
jgi:hypothetical protein